MTRKQHPYREQGLSVFLAVLMVLSVVAMGAFVGPVAATHDPADADKEIVEDQNPSVWQGQTIVFDFSAQYNASDQFEITGEQDVGEFELDADGHSNVIDSSDFPRGDYQVVEADNRDVVVTEFSVREQQLDADFAASEVEQNSQTSLTIDSQRSGPFNVVIASDDGKLEGTDLAAIFDDATVVETGANHIEVSDIRGGAGTETTLNANFDGVAVDSYDLTFDVTDTTGSAEASISVVEEVEEVFTASFDQDEFQTSVADTQRFSINLENHSIDDNVTLRLEDSNADYVVEVEFTNFDEDADSITIDWLTYHSGLSASSGSDVGLPDHLVFFPLAGFDSGVGHADRVNITEETEVDTDFHPIEPDLYFGQLFLDPDEPRVDTANFQLDDGEIGELETNIAPKGSFDLNAGDRGDLSEISSEFDEVAEGDLLVLEVEASGLYNYMGAGLIHDPIDREFNRAAGMSFEVMFEGAEQRYQHPETASFNETDDSVAVHHGDGHRDNFIYIVIDTENVANGSLEAGQEWTVTFGVDSPVGEESQPLHDEVERTTTFTVLERSLDFDVVEDDYQVAPVEDSEIHLSTTLAPGTAVEGDIDFRPVDRVFTNAEVTVNDDGERVVVFSEDLSGFEDHVGEELTLRASATDAADETSAVWNMTPEHETIGQIERLEQQIADLEDQVEDRDGTISDLEGQVSDLQDDVDEQRERADAAESDLDDANSRIDDLEGQVSDLESRDSAWQEATGVDNPEDVEDEDDEQPAFGPIAALIALLAGGAMVARRRL